MEMNIFQLVLNLGGLAGATVLIIYYNAKKDKDNSQIQFELAKMFAENFEKSSEKTAEAIKIMSSQNAEYMANLRAVIENNNYMIKDLREMIKELKEKFFLLDKDHRQEKRK